METVRLLLFRQEQYQAEIEALLTRDGEEHTKLKIKLETDIQVGKDLWCLDHESRSLVKK